MTSSWSRDGRWVYFFSKRSGRNEAWKVSPEGGDAIQVTTRRGTVAFESPDGAYLYCGKADLSGRPPGIWRIPRDGGEEVQILDRGGDAWWPLTETGILYLDVGSKPPTLEFFDLARRDVSWAAPLDVFVRAPVLSASPDGRWVLFTAAERLETDIMLVEGFR